MSKEIVLITGTNSGFGYLSTLKLASQGYTVIATMRNLSKQTALRSEVKQKKLTDRIEILPLDVTNQEHIEQVQQYVERQYGKIDILINNAGYSTGGITELLDLEEWKAQFETNLFGVIAVTKAFLPMMRERRQGKIINIGSISGHVGFPGLGPYVSSKFALSGFSESLRLELLPFNIHVSIVEPGSYKTDIWEKALSKINLTTESEYDEFLQKIYAEAKRSGEQAACPDEVIEVITNICRSKNPKFRYPVGKGIRSVIFMKNILPWSWFEAIVRRKMK
ncbi:SDR family oxidoreductase [Alkalihalobacterium elongatum]|uniref:SDR family oxidoreductase n=1 Tax=Alkalihalobacterium elongatum TaxID=2675466 RepID=UPI001C1FFD6F|nr:SDR family oxidoreductase [Alkalihalobacterium elongatum]